MMCFLFVVVFSSLFLFIKFLMFIVYSFMFFVFVRLVFVIVRCCVDVGLLVIMILIFGVDGFFCFWNIFCIIFKVVVRIIKLLRM